MIENSKAPQMGLGLGELDVNKYNLAVAAKKQERIKEGKHRPARPIEEVYAKPLDFSEYDKKLELENKINDIVDGKMNEEPEKSIKSMEKLNELFPDVVDNKLHKRQNESGDWWCYSCQQHLSVNLFSFLKREQRPHTYCRKCCSLKRSKNKG